MSSSFFNPKNQHLKNLVPVWTKKDQTDASPDDYIDISWFDTQDDLEITDKKIVSTDALQALNDKLETNLGDFQEKADELVEKAIEHHIKDVAKFKETVEKINDTIDAVESASIGRDNALQELLDETNDKLDVEIANRVEADKNLAEMVSGIHQELAHEITQRELSEKSLDARISNNTRIGGQALQRVLDEEKARKADIAQEREERAESDKALEANLSLMINGIHSELATETTQREMEDTKIREHIEWTKNELDEKLTFNINTQVSGLRKSMETLLTAVRDKLNAEIDRSTTKDEELDTKIDDTKVELDEKIVANTEKIDELENNINRKITDEIEDVLHSGVLTAGKLEDEIEDRLRVDAEQAQLIEDNYNELHDIALQSIVHKEVEILRDSEGIFKYIFPEGAHIERIENKSTGIYLYPKSIYTETDGIETTTTITLYDAEQAPQDFKHYTLIRVLYSCTYGEYVAWEKRQSEEG